MEPKDILARARAAGRTALDEADGKALLSGFGIPVPRTVVLPDADAAAAALKGLTPPFALKVVSPDILHKSDAGGVRLGLKDAREVSDAIHEMAELPKIKPAKVEGWLVEEMAPKGREVVVGALLDPQFGPMVMVGLGGIFVEILADVSFRLCPITERDARAMIDELRGRKLLDGARGEPPAHIESIVRTLMGVGGPDGLMTRHGSEIAELDINPMIVGEHAAMAVDARVILAKPEEEVPRKPRPGDTLSPLERFRPLYEPRTIAVAGASSTGVTIANTFIRRMKDFGYKGQLYPIHPKADEIEGLKAYPGLTETPEEIDYLYVAIGSKRITDLLASAGGRVKIAQVISSGFAEVEEGRELERELVEKAHAGGCRVVGPNCLGSYSPRGGLTFPANAPKEVGSVGIVAQSGGLTTDIIKRGQWRGLRYSGAVTMGNSCDVTPTDLVEYYMEDPQTRVVGLYIEDIKNGRAFFDLLRSSKATKPVVILKGGRSQLGRMAAASHTGALAGDERAWEALCAQTGAVMVATVDEFIDVLLAFQHLDPNPARPTENVVLFGNGGGTSVLATDYFAGLGLSIKPFETATRAKLEALNLPPGTSVANPIDAPVATLQEEDGWVAGRILDLVYDNAHPDAVVMHLNLAAFVGRGSSDPIGNLMKVAEDINKRRAAESHFVLALRSDGSPELDDSKRHYREIARKVGIPVYDELANAAQGLSALGHYERHLAATAQGR